MPTVHTRLSDRSGQTEFSAKMEIGHFILIICAGDFVSPELKIYLILAFVKKNVKLLSHFI